MNNTQRLARIDDLLKGLPQFKCVEGCNACCGPVGASRLEWARIVQTSGRTDKDIQAEAGQNVAAFEADGDPGHLKCPLLKDGKCSVYAVRPAICRLFGVVDHEKLTCPHGGTPEALISNELAMKIQDEIDRLGF